MSFYGHELIKQLFVAKLQRYIVVADAAFTIKWSWINGWLRYPSSLALYLTHQFTSCRAFNRLRALHSASLRAKGFSCAARYLRKVI